MYLESPVSANSRLESLNCRDNQIPELDISKNLSLNRLYCKDNQESGKMVIKMYKGQKDKISYFYDVQHCQIIEIE